MASKLSNTKLELNNNIIEAIDGNLLLNDEVIAKEQHRHNYVDILDIVDFIYPIGSIFKSFENRNPQDFLPGTFWESIRGKFLFAEDDSHAPDTPEGEGGEFEHTLTIDEMPSHDHWIKLSPDGGLDADRSSRSDRWNGSNVAQTNWVGGSQPHNNMPPYHSIYMWRRINSK